MNTKKQMDQGTELCVYSMSGYFKGKEKNGFNWEAFEKNGTY